MHVDDVDDVDDVRADSSGHGLSKIVRFRNRNISEPFRRVLPALGALAFHGSKPRGSEFAHDLTRVNDLRPKVLHVAEQILRNVIVVKAKGEVPQPRFASERVQLIEAGVADEVTPESAVPRPLRRIHKDCHQRPAEEFIGFSMRSTRPKARIFLRTVASSEAMEHDDVNLSIPARPRFLQLVRVTAANIGVRLGWSIIDTDQLRTAVDECTATLVGPVPQPGNLIARFHVGADELHVELALAGENEAIPGERVEHFHQIIESITTAADIDPVAGRITFTKVRTA